MIGFAHNGGMTLHDVGIFHRLDRRGGDVHDNIAMIKWEFNVGDALRACFELESANGGGH